jgi:hypothetical protein
MLDLLVYLRAHGFKMFIVSERVPPYAIGTVAMFWVIQRLATF